MGFCRTSALNHPVLGQCFLLSHIFSEQENKESLQTHKKRLKKSLMETNNQTWDVKNEEKST